MALAAAPPGDVDWADVSEGQEITGFTLPITMKTLVLAVVAPETSCLTTTTRSSVTASGFAMPS